MVYSQHIHEVALQLCKAINACRCCLTKMKILTKYFFSGLFANESSRCLDVVCFCLV